SPALTTRTAGDEPTSTNDASDTPKASAMRQGVPIDGLVRFCSLCTSIPLLTPDRPASSSSVQACSVRRERTLREMVEMVAAEASVILLNPWCNRALCLSFVPTGSMYRPAAPSSHEPDQSTLP